MGEYADPQSCSTCHRQIAESYKLTGMGRSLRMAGTGAVPEDFSKPEFYHPESDTHFAMLRRDGQVYQRRWQIGVGGKDINVEEMKVDYVMGSGNHARSYLSRTAAGTLRMGCI